MTPSEEATDDVDEVPSHGETADTSPLVTTRFKHIVTKEGPAIITGRDDHSLQRCEDEPIHTPGAVQGFGLLIALEQQQDSKFLVRIVSENSESLMRAGSQVTTRLHRVKRTTHRRYGYTARQSQTTRYIRGAGCARSAITTRY